MSTYTYKWWTSKTTNRLPLFEDEKSEEEDSDDDDEQEKAREEADAR